MRLSSPLLLAVLMLVGCRAPAPSNAEPSAPVAREELDGTYIFYFHDHDDSPKSKLGSALSESFELHLHQGEHFDLSMLGVSIYGKVQLEGSELTLEPELVAGLTEEELAQRAQGDVISFEQARLTGRVEKGGAVLVLSSEDSEPMYFVRQPREVIEEKVTGGEKTWVGTWAATEVRSPREATSEAGRKAQEQQERTLLAMRFELRQDKTFFMNFISEASGTWELNEGVISLTPDQVAGYEGVEAPEPMRFRIVEDKLLLEPENGEGGTVVFERR